MAEHHVETDRQSAMDYAEHEKTYRMFVQYTKYTIAAVAVLLVLLAFFLG